jgi:hypothetical protein
MTKNQRESLEIMIQCPKKVSLDKINRRLNTTKESISKLVYTLIETMK